MTIDTFGNFVEQWHDVERSAALLERLYLIEREQMRALAGRHIAIEDWTAKNVLPRHWWLASLHADALRERVLELRYPRRDVDTDHDKGLAAFLGELTKGEADAEFEPDSYPLSLGLYAFRAQRSTEWALLMAASVLVTLPVIALFALGQRNLLSAIKTTGLVR